jgi:hypothetical protein
LASIVRDEEVIFSVLFLLKLSQDVANHILGFLNALFLNLLVFLCFLSVIFIKFRLFVVLWPQKNLFFKQKLFIFTLWRVIGIQVLAGDVAD